MSANSAIIDIEEKANGQLEYVTAVLTLETDMEMVAQCLTGPDLLPELFPSILKVTDLGSEKGQKLVELTLRYQFYLISCAFEVVCMLETDGRTFMLFRGVRGNVDDFLFRVQVKEKANRILLYVTFKFDVSTLGPILQNQLQQHPEVEVAMLSAFSLGFARSFKQAVERRKAA